MLNAESQIDSQKKPTVLIVDDDPAIIQFLGARCTRLGLDVQTARNGLQALVMAQRNRPDVLIVDVNLPEVDGLSLSFHLLRPDTKGLEVIVVTGGSSDEAMERCGALGAAFVRKGPTLWTQVQSVLNRILPAISRASDDAIYETAEPAVPQRPRILIVDDDPDVGQFLESRLRKLGLEPVLAKDGADGYRLAIRCKPSVILSDCYMANGDISYLVARLRANSATEKIPVFAMTSRPIGALESSQLLKDVLGRPGPSLVLRKPLDLQLLVKEVNRFAVG